jgi:hypothetical protein
MLAGLFLPLASKSEERPAFIKCKPMVSFERVSVLSQNDVAGTRQRHSALSQPRQRGDFRLRTFVTGALPRWGGGGSPSDYGEFWLPVAGRSVNRRHGVGVGVREAREVARQVALDPKEAQHGLLAAAHAVEIAKWGRRTAKRGGRTIGKREAVVSRPRFGGAEPLKRRKVPMIGLGLVAVVVVLVLIWITRKS